MSAPMIAILVAAALAGLVTWWVRNSLVARRTRVRESLSGVHVQLQRRADLVPNLVATVRAYMAHEKDLLDRLVELRTEFLRIPSDDADGLGANAHRAGEALGRIFALSEEAPQLRASETFIELQEQLAETEDQIAAARRIHNANVNELNTTIGSFPANMVAWGFRIRREAFFATSPGRAGLTGSGAGGRPQS